MLAACFGFPLFVGLQTRRKEQSRRRSAGEAGEMDESSSGWVSDGTLSEFVNPTTPPPKKKDTVKPEGTLIDTGVRKAFSWDVDSTTSEFTYLTSPQTLKRTGP